MIAFILATQWLTGLAFRRQMRRIRRRLDAIEQEHALQHQLGTPSTDFPLSA